MDMIICVVNVQQLLSGEDQCNSSRTTSEGMRHAEKLRTPPLGRILAEGDLDDDLESCSSGSEVNEVVYEPEAGK